MVNFPLVTQVNLNLKSIPLNDELKFPFVTHGEFIIPTTCGFATRGRNYTIPTPPPEGIAAFITFPIFSAQSFSFSTQSFSFRFTQDHNLCLPSDHKTFFFICLAFYL